MKVIIGVGFSRGWAGEREVLLTAGPKANIPPDIALPHLDRILAGLPALEGHPADLVRRHGDGLLNAHRRVRKAVRAVGAVQRIDPRLPPDVLGAYVYLPAD